MKFLDLFEKFDTEGQLLTPGAQRQFCDLPWRGHPTFEGVALKHLITSQETNGQFSCHLVKIAPRRKIGSHVHQTQLETHEVVAGSGTCINNGAQIGYEPGVVSIFPANIPHEVAAGEDGLYLFAKFIPALL